MLYLSAGIWAAERFEGADQCSARRVQFERVMGDVVVLDFMDGSEWAVPFAKWILVSLGEVDGEMCSARPRAAV